MTWMTKTTRPGARHRKGLWLALGLCGSYPSLGLAQAPVPVVTEDAEQAAGQAPVEVRVEEPEGLRLEPAPTVEAPSGPRFGLGLGEGLVASSADGRFSIQVRGRAQLRYEGTFDRLRGDTEGSSTFMARRVRLLLRGNLFSEHLEYYIQFGFSNRDTEPDLRLPLRDAYVTWSRLRDLNVRFGQMKVPFGLQRVISSSALQFPDRSIATQELNLDRDVGVHLFSRDLFGLGGRLGYALGVFGGDGRNRTGRDFGMLYVGRLVVSPMGPIADFAEADHTRHETPRLSLGLSGAVNMSSVRMRSTFEGTYTLGSYDFVHAGLDASFKYRGFSAQVELFYRDVLGVRERTDASNPMQIVTETSRTGTGYYAQAGYLFDAHWELAARFGEIRPRRNVPTGLAREGELGLGLGYYFYRHDFKVQLDYYMHHRGALSDQSARDNVFRIQSQIFL